MPPFVNLTGKKIGRLTVLSVSAKGPGIRTSWKCLCECGKYVDVLTSRLRTDKPTSSCGCLLHDVLVKRNLKHGLSSAPEYGIWCNIHSRCVNKNCVDYPNYGGRGIKICEHFSDFKHFYDGVGSRPSERHTLDRIHNNHGYSCGSCADCVKRGEPNNCRWVLRLEQNNNKRNNRRITYNNQTRTVSEWSRVLGVKYITLYARIFTYGWSVEEAFSGVRSKSL